MSKRRSSTSGSARRRKAEPAAAAAAVPDIVQGQKARVASRSTRGSLGIQVGPAVVGREELLEVHMACAVCGGAHLLTIRNGIPDPLPRCPRANGGREGFMMPAAMNALAQRPAVIQRTMRVLSEEGMEEQNGRQLDLLARLINFKG